MKKPFYRLPIYPIKRSKFNPLRYIFGDHYLSGDVKKYTAQFPLDTSDIAIVPNPDGEPVNDFIASKYFEKWQKENRELIENYFDKAL